MAEKSSDLCQPNKEAHLHTAVVVSYDTEPLEQALLSQRHAALEPPVLNLDIIFTILCFLPTEVVLRLKTMCRAWSQLISDPLFIRAHSSRPAPVTGCFSQKITGFKKTRYCFSPLETSPRFPTMITVIQSRGFKAVSTSYGLVCFRRKKDGVIIVANPATSHWALIPSPVTPPSPDCTCVAYAPNLIYDPIISLHFKLAIGITYRTSVLNASTFDHRLRFHVYSSETSSWIVSSIYPSGERISGPQPIDLDNCKVSGIG